ncbi:hypothetical protein KUTeg_003842 [Tegillarca granosa]|uniref:Uncharacterized protein n=1 Tax=Tegillarca granosa TaxID=220873 RepID=A0ABQ9FPX5_TEGGR|nr:hypothetical protein KUTeg_003842 [Tegillarca granosa]
MNASREQFETAIDVNLKGAFNVSQVIKSMLEKNSGGSIVNISSIDSIKPRVILAIANYMLFVLYFDLCVLSMAHYNI